MVIIYRLITNFCKLLIINLFYFKIMTVKELKSILYNLPDDMIVGQEVNDIGGLKFYSLNKATVDFIEKTLIFEY